MRITVFERVLAIQLPIAATVSLLVHSFSLPLPLGSVVALFEGQPPFQGDTFRNDILLFVLDTSS